MIKATLPSPTLLRFAIAILSFAFTAIAHSQETREKLPDGEVNKAYSEQLTGAPEGTSFAATGLPPGMDINSSTGTIAGTPTTAGVYDNVTLTLTYPNLNSDDFLYEITIVAASGTPSITSATTASGTVGQTFLYAITADNSPESFNVSGDLPDGLTSSEEAISGTPTEAGTFAITLSGNNASGTGAESTLTITIDPAGPVPAISSAAALSGDPNEPISYQIVASESPTSYAASGLPLGLSINESTGFINGEASIEGVYDVQLTATNSNGTSSVFELTVTIGKVPVISSTLAVSITELYEMDEYRISASNNPTTFTVATESLPQGLSYDSESNRISGIPTQVGTFNIELSASNAVGDGPKATLTITVDAKQQAPQLRSASYTVVRSADNFELYLDFDQSVEDLAAYDWIIETSSDLETWEQLDLDDDSLTLTVTDNEDSSKSVSVKYPNLQSTDTYLFIRYRVEAKQ